MSEDQDKLLIYFDNETHLIRRLGAAVVSCWATLPKAVRDQIVEKAKIVIDDEQIDDVDAQIRQFIADHNQELPVEPGQMEVRLLPGGTHLEVTTHDGQPFTFPIHELQATRRLPRSPDGAQALLVNTPLQKLEAARAAAQEFAIRADLI